MPIPDILYEDNHILAVNKRVSDLVQGDKTGDESLLEALKAHIKERDRKPGNVFLGLVHRIDRPVSGVVLYAKTSKALSRCNELLREGSMEKVYWAIVCARPPENEGRLVHYLLKNAEKNKSFVVSEKDAKRRGAKEARLSYRVLGDSEHYFFLELRIETGRHHQIRAQLAAIHCPIKGDLKYGAPRSNPDGGIGLHARSLGFIHPVRGERMTVVAPPPADVLWDLFPGNMTSAAPA